MKSSKDEFVETYESYIRTLIKQQAELMIEVDSLQQALELHNADSAKYHLVYNHDKETGIFTYTKVMKKRIGF